MKLDIESENFQSQITYVNPSDLTDVYDGAELEEISEDIEEEVE